jgi:serine/threonine protein phosphatase 1
MGAVRISVYDQREAPAGGDAAMTGSVTSEEDVREHHHRIDADHWEDIYVVGDVHGCRDALDRLVARIDPDDRTLLVFVGDLVRKGPDSHAVVEFVRSSPNAVSVQGNNERKVIDGEKSVPGLTADDRAYLESLPVVITWDDELVVHGGVDPRKPLADHTERDLLEMRSFTPDNDYERPYWFERYSGSPRVFFGHTVLDAPHESAGAVGLDTGCVYGGELTAYHCETGAFVSVEPTETHQGRSADSIVSPTAPAEQ